VKAMKKLEIITRPEKLEDVKELANSLGIYGMTASMVSGCGLQKGRKEIYRGTEYNINLLPKIKIEMIVKDEVVERLIDGISDKVKTGEVGDGKIFIYNVEDAIRIRTGERGEKAI
jgi:nitrogen regulatory protein P-II 1